MRQLAGWLRDLVTRFRVRAQKGNPAIASLSYRYLARQIDSDLPVTEGGRVIIFSSPAAMELSNEAMRMLAYFMCDELGCRILLIDGTFDEEGIGWALGHPAGPGFLDVLYGTDRRVKDVVQPTSHANIWVMPAGRSPAAVLQPIAPGQISEPLAEARAAYDYVIIQQRSICDDSRYLVFAGKADLTLLLVEEGGTPVTDLERCMEVYRNHEITNVRLIMTTAQ